jgi:four helix bundle protein
MAKENLILNKTFDFSLSTIKLYKHLTEQKEYILSKQLLRSGTSIGAKQKKQSVRFQKESLLQRCVFLLKKPESLSIG